MYDIITIYKEKFMNILELKNGRRILISCKDNEDLQTIDEVLKTINIIDSNAFAENNYLTEINIPDNVVYIGDGAFARCANLKKVKLPEKLQKIKYGTFLGCASLEEVNIPENVNEIEPFAFSGCIQLKRVNLPKDCSIMPSAFREAGLVELTIPDIDTVEARVFADCKQLTKVEIKKGTDIPAFAFINCANLKQVILPEEIYNINHHSFAMCTNLESINLPKGLKYIQEGAFSQCIKLQNITLPVNLEFVGKYAFNYCGLDKVEIPKNCGLHMYSFDERVDIKYLTASEIIQREGKRMLQGEIKEPDERFIKGMVTKAVLSSQMTHHEFLKSQALLKQITECRKSQQADIEQPTSLQKIEENSIEV